MKRTGYLVLLTLLLFLLAACGQAPGDEPAAIDNDAPVSSEDPLATPTKMADDENLLIRDAMVEDLQILILESFPVQVHAVVRGYLGDGCTSLGEITTEQEGNTFKVNITSVRPADAICTQQLVGFEESVSLDVHGLEAGDYTVDVNGMIATFTLDVDNVLPDEGTG